MEDEQIVELYWNRAEDAISETANKYGRYCRTIAFNILYNENDTEECVNDTYLNAWNSMPPQRPVMLRAFLGRLTRNLSLNRYKQLTAEKRGKGQVTLALDELQECIPACGNTESVVDEIVLTQLLNRFLESLGAEQRKIFIRRYWYLSPVKEIAGDFGMGESKVKMSLLRSRRQLRKLLEEEAEK